MDPEYTVIGRVARRIWAIAMKEKYGANERSQKLKYHVQTSAAARLHAQEMDFNDIRTTLQALVAIYDNANSLHTNAYDEAVTTPSEESVRRALAIQMIITKEWGLAVNENPLQGAFVVDELTDLVEAAVLAEFDRISERGGVLGAMETGYQRGQHPGRVDALRAPQARRLAPDRRRQHLPQAARPTRRPARSRSPGPPRSRRRASWPESRRTRPSTRSRRRRRWHGSRRRRPRARTSSPCSWMPPACVRCSRSPRRSSRWAGSTAATCSRDGGSPLTGGPAGVGRR